MQQWFSEGPVARKQTSLKQGMGVEALGHGSDTGDQEVRAGLDNPGDKQLLTSQPSQGPGQLTSLSHDYYQY